MRLRNDRIENGEVSDPFDLQTNSGLIHRSAQVRDLLIGRKISQSGASQKAAQKCKEVWEPVV